MSFDNSKKLVFIRYDSLLTKNGKVKNEMFPHNWELVKEEKRTKYYELTIDDSYLEKAF
jgi:hypothetical protein